MGRTRKKMGKGSARRIVGIVTLLLVAVALVIPMAPYIAMGVLTALASLGVVLQVDPIMVTASIILGVPRILGSLWIYFKVDNMWGNEAAYMALFLLSPLLGIIVFMIARDKLSRPPPGYEYARIEKGIVHQPIYEFVGPPQAAQVPSGIQYGQHPPQAPPPPPPQPPAPPTRITQPPP
ncbi:MAG: hypothetical protein GQ558_02475, partial [Thermoplasmata archaeon]|nr:hypothetical protein [Thermoplasmata archaeon]